MSAIVLRDYQSASIERLRDGIRAGHRCQILNSPTGSGKGVLLAFLLQEAQVRGSRCAVVVDRVSLVDQISATLDSYNIPHGVIQADHWRKRPKELVQVCSLQTLESRGFYIDNLDLAIHDEAHVSHAALRRFFAQTKAKVVGLTATALTKGLGTTYTNIVNVTTTNALIKEGWLSPLRIYIAKAPDMKGAKVVGSEWADQEVESRSLSLVGDVVQEWTQRTRENLGGPCKTICFSSTVAHGEEICRQFNSAGHNFVQISYRDGGDSKRRAVIEEFRKPDSSITGLVSVDALIKGFDVPDIKCLIIARPFRKSLSSHIQMLGRGMRIAPGKEFCLVLDHANNCIRFRDDTDDIFENGITKIDNGKLESKLRKEPEEADKKALCCGKCGYLLTPGTPTCPCCGAERVKRSLVEVLPGELVPFDGTQRPEPAREKGTMATWMAPKDYTWQQLCGEGVQRKKGDLDKAKRWALAHYKALYNEWPAAPFDGSLPPMTDLQLRSRVTAQTIRWAHSPFQRKRA